MEKGKTKSGFEFEVDSAVFDDWEILEKLNEIDNGNSALMVDVARQVLGQEQLDALKEHVKELNGGKASITAMGEALGEIFEACNTSKN